MARKRHLLAGIDVGTTKICSVIATIDEGKVRIPGIGWSDSKGLKKGIVVNLTETIDSVRKSLDQAETEARTVVDSAFVSVGGIHIQGLNASGRTDLRDQLFVMDIYAAGEEPIPGVSSRHLVEQIGRYRQVAYADDRRKLVEELKRATRPGDLLLTLGAGDVWKIGEAYLED